MRQPARGRGAGALPTVAPGERVLRCRAAVGGAAVGEEDTQPDHRPERADADFGEQPQAQGQRRPPPGAQAATALVDGETAPQRGSAEKGRRCVIADRAAEKGQFGQGGGQAGSQQGDAGPRGQGRARQAIDCGDRARAQQGRPEPRPLHGPGGGGPGPLLWAGVDEEVGRLGGAGGYGAIGIGAQVGGRGVAQMADGRGGGVIEGRMLALGDAWSLGQPLLQGKVDHIGPVIGLVGRFAQGIAHAISAGKQEVQQRQQQGNPPRRAVDETRHGVISRAARPGMIRRRGQSPLGCWQQCLWQCHLVRPRLLRLSLRRGWCAGGGRAGLRGWCPCR